LAAAAAARLWLRAQQKPAAGITWHLLFFSPKTLSASAQRAVIPLYLSRNITEKSVGRTGAGGVRGGQRGDARVLGERLRSCVKTKSQKDDY
jgi:hypothetical protein